jgi:cold shock CspA family protein
MDRYGVNQEERLMTKLQSLGCRILKDNVYDHEYKIDFVINAFEGIARLVQIGVQLTLDTDNLRKMSEFCKIQETHKIVPKAVYVELDSNLDIERSGATLVYSALVYFAFSKQHATDTVIGLRIRSDGSLEFFDLKRKLMELRRLTGQPEGALLQGAIKKYNAQRGYGFIQGEDPKDSYFFHISSIHDESLTRQLELEQIGQHVTFRSLGIVRQDVTSPQATEVKLDLSVTEDLPEPSPPGIMMDEEEDNRGNLL